MIYEICSNYSILQALSILLTVFNVICIIVPIIIIVYASVDFFKSITSNDTDSLNKAVKTSMRRLIAGVVVFFIPTIVLYLTNFLNDTLNANLKISTCLENVNNIGYFKELEDTLKQQKKEKLEAEEKRLLEESYSYIQNNYNHNTNSEGTYLGTTYTNLTEDELTFLTIVSRCEQGDNLQGIAIEASLMANLYELHYSGFQSVYSFVKKSGWFACARDYNINKYSKKITEEHKSVVKSVLVLGNRVLPLYVDEHDCIYCSHNEYCDNGNRGDVCEIKVDNNKTTDMNIIRNKSNYKKDNTVIYNKAGSVWTFYEFACETCDPFGYTASAKQKYDRLNNS